MVGRRKGMEAVIVQETSVIPISKGQFFSLLVFEHGYGSNLVFVLLHHAHIVVICADSL